jgi:predicted flap endonuclease-1-like 5' DNA nuclease
LAQNPSKLCYNKAKDWSIMSRLITFILGLFIGVRIGQMLSPQPDSAHAPAPPSPVSSRPVSAPPPVKKADPLTTIDGIGPAFEQALNALGITTFADLARQDVDELAARLPVRITAERIRRDQWIEQAQRLKDEQAKS